MKRLFQIVLISLSIVALFSSCGGDSKPAAKAEVKKAPAIPETMALTIEGNDAMKFNKERLTVYEGQEITLTLKHVGQLTADAMGHNWTLLAAGVDVDVFAMEAINYPDNEYLPPNSEAKILARTRMLGGGESESITFTAPAAGTYTYLCTFPGHYPMMKGKFVVKARK